MEKCRLDHRVNMSTNIIRPIPARGKENQHYKSPARQFTFSIQNMFARTFTFIAIIAATVIGTCFIDMIISAPPLLIDPRRQRRL